MGEFYIDNDGIKLHAKLDRPDDRKGPLVIVIHGFTGHMEERHIMAVSEAINAAGIATLNVEMYGHGKSGGKFEDHTLFKWITNALCVIDYAKTLDFVTDLYLCGHSQGGLLVMLAAGMKPDDVKAITLLSPAWMIPEWSRKGELLDVSFDPLHIPDELTDGERKLNGNYIRVAQMIHVEDAIARYKRPVLIVHGDEDESVPVCYAKKAAKLYEDAQLYITHGDHHCYDLHLPQVVGIVQRFFLDITGK